MTAIDPKNPGDELWRSIEESYWERVAETVRKVFSGNPDLVRSFRRQLEIADPLERSLIMHEDPLDLASDIAGQTVTEQHQHLYEELFGEN
jgi:hypothetical protein